MILSKDYMIWHVGDLVCGIVLEVKTEALN